MRVTTFAVTLLGMISLVTWGGGRARGQETQIDSLRAAARSSATEPSAALALGRGLRRAGRSTQALAELRRGVALAGTQAAALIDLRWEVARVYIDRHEFGQALDACAALGKVRDASPGGAPGASGRGAVAAAEGHACAADAHLIRQRATEALREASLALALDPQCYEAKVAEGRADELALDIARSEAAFRAAIAWRPDGADAHLALGRVLLKDAPRRDDALAELRRAVALDPHGPDALYELAMALAPSAESTALLERSTGERPLFADAWLELGGQELAVGRVADARVAAEAAVRDDGKSVGPRVLLGKVALADSRYDDAIKQGDAALKILANSAPAQLLVADANAKKGEIDRALEAYQSAWGLDRADPTPLVHAAEACHLAGRDTSARAFASKATTEFPEWAPGWAALGDALVGQGEKAAAREAYAKALATKGPVDRDAIKKKVATLR